MLDKCPDHWRVKCWPTTTTTTTTTITTTTTTTTTYTKPTPPPNPTGYNVIYLVDEHDVTGNQNMTPLRNGPTLVRRWAFQHDEVNLQTLNAGEWPTTITLHEKIANPKFNPGFRWEGYMFDIPGGKAAMRVAIVAGADQVGNNTLDVEGPSKADRVVGFAGVYPDVTLPFGPVIQVRRDDSYRCLGSDFSRPVKLTWRCAYYITRATPTGNTGLGLPRRNLVADGGGPDEPPASEEEPPKLQDGTPDYSNYTYDQLLDANIDDKVVVGDTKWDGQAFGFKVGDFPPDESPNPPETYSGNILEELESNYKDAANSA